VKRYALLFLSASLTVLVFVMSLQTGEVSGSMSSPITLALARLIETVFPRMTFDLDTLHLIVRKCAHVTEYGALGIAYALTAIAWKVRPWIACVAGAGIAFLDEWIQGFIPGRGPDPFDALCFDIPGFLIGLVAVLLVAGRIGRNRRHRNNVS